MRLSGNLKLLTVIMTLFAAGNALAADLTVSAASSLTNAFQEIAKSYESLHLGTKVALNFASSGALLQQIAKGAPVDVYASADEVTMDQAQQQALVVAAERHDIVRNALVVIVPAHTKIPPKRLGDLSASAIKRVAIGNIDSVPAGRYARRALEGAGLWSTVQAKAITTQNVRQALDYVARGEVDAGFVYATDAALRRDEVEVAFDVPLDTPISYAVATVSASSKREEAGRFIQYLLSPAGQAIFARYGFRAPA